MFTSTLNVFFTLLLFGPLCLSHTDFRCLLAATFPSPRCKRAERRQGGLRIEVSRDTPTEEEKKEGDKQETREVEGHAGADS